VHIGSAEDLSAGGQRPFHIATRTRVQQILVSKDVTNLSCDATCLIEAIFEALERRKVFACTRLKESVEADDLSAGGRLVNHSLW
jgi:hypothetical protein